MTDQFRVIIAGSRDFNDYALLKEKCDFFFSKRRVTSIICGEARGADLLGKKYAIEHKIQVQSFPADWDTHGKKAGFLRNEEMARHADALIAFWDGSSRGTANMIEIARRMGLSIRVVKI